MRFRILCALVFVLFVSNTRAADAPPLLADKPTDADVNLVTPAQTADVYFDSSDFAVVRITANLFAEDVERVTGKKPVVKNDVAALSNAAVIVGTLGHSPVIDKLVADKKLDVSNVAGKWETFVVATVDNPLPNVQRALVVAGSDRRGSAFGLLEVSEQIGVSPWYWWADSTPAHHDTLAIRAGANVVGPPSVKYRGIFINDEDWGLKPWAAKTFDPKFGNIGPKTYAKVFELMLRLKANYLWPAMHPCSTEFGKVEENIKLADDYAIVMGASHAEPMNRNNVEWPHENRGEFSYTTNRQAVYDYWKEWAQKRGPYEAVWTVGMRGIHDSAMIGAKTVEDQVRNLTAAITDQRKLLGEFVNKNVAQVPQAFMPYKEALNQYQHGLQVPDDVTLVWCEDNFGYIRQLSTPTEQKRSGGSGIYYHISYLGTPKPYLWINTTPPALIYEEMHKALAYGADRIWVLNVGDIKPGEIGMEFWLKYAWNTSRYSANAQDEFLTEFMTREFGKKAAPELVNLMDDYYRLGLQRKPELMESGAFPPQADGAARRLADAMEIRRRADEIAADISAGQKDSYFEFVQYPAHVTDFVNEAIMFGDAAQSRHRPAASMADVAKASTNAVDQLRADTEKFNNTLANGKWKNIMTLKGNDTWGREWLLQWPTISPAAPAEATNHFCIAVDNSSSDPIIDGKISENATMPPTDATVDFSALPKPWVVAGSGDKTAAIVPNGVGNSIDVSKSTALTFNVDLKVHGHYNLFALVTSPTPDDDSFFVRVDGGKWAEWNSIAPTETLAWRRHAAYDLAAGAHKIEVANREDGTSIRAIRLTTRDVADAYVGPPVTELRQLADIPDRETVTLELYNTDGSPSTARVQTSDPWIVVHEKDLFHSHRVTVSVNWANAPADQQFGGTVTVTNQDQATTFNVHALRLPTDGTFGELDGAVSMLANHFNRGVDGATAKWTAIPHLSRVGDAAMTVWPENAASIATPEDVIKSAARLEYDFTSTSTGEATLSAYNLPTYRTNAERGLRYATQIDDGPLQIIDYNETGGPSGEHSPAWLDHVRRNLAISETRHTLKSAGKHTLKVYTVDPGVVMDKLVLAFKPQPPTDSGPPETRTMQK